MKKNYQPEKFVLAYQLCLLVYCLILSTFFQSFDIFFSLLNFYSIDVTQYFFILVCLGSQSFVNTHNYFWYFHLAPQFFINIVQSPSMDSNNGSPSSFYESSTASPGNQYHQFTNLTSPAYSGNSTPTNLNLLMTSEYFVFKFNIYMLIGFACLNDLIAKIHTWKMYA